MAKIELTAERKKQLVDAAKKYWVDAVTKQLKDTWTSFTNTPQTTTPQIVWTDSPVAKAPKPQPTQQIIWTNSPVVKAPTPQPTQQTVWTDSPVAKAPKPQPTNVNIKPTTIPKVETPKAEVMTPEEEIIDWKNKWSNINSLESIIEKKYWTIATVENGKIKADINWETYEWGINEAGDAIKTKITAPLTSDDVYSQMMLGQKVEDTWIPWYSIAKARYDTISKYLWMWEEALYNAYVNKEITSEMEKDLAQNPYIWLARERYNQKVITDNINSSSLRALNSYKKWNGIDYKEEEVKEEKTSLEKLLEYFTAQGKDIPPFQDYINTNYPELQTQNEELNQKNEDIQRLVDERDKRFDEIIKENPWISLNRATMLAARQNKDTNEQIKSMSYEIANLQANINYQTTMADKAYSYDLNQQARQDKLIEAQRWMAFDLYKTEDARQYNEAQTEDARQYQQALIQEQRQYEAENQWIPTSIINLWDKQQLINTQTGEVISEYKTPQIAKTWTQDYELKEVNGVWYKFNKVTWEMTKLDDVWQINSNVSASDAVLWQYKLSDWSTITATKWTVNALNKVMSESPDIQFDIRNLYRTQEDQFKLYWQGRTEADLWKSDIPIEYARPDLPQVTWTTKSSHMTWNAVDVVAPQKNKEDQKIYLDSIEPLMNANWFERPESTMARWDFWHFEYKGVKQPEEQIWITDMELQKIQLSDDMTWSQRVDYLKKEGIYDKYLEYKWGVWEKVETLALDMTAILPRDLYRTDADMNRVVKRVNTAINKLEWEWIEANLQNVADEVRGWRLKSGINNEQAEYLRSVLTKNAWKTDRIDWTTVSWYLNKWDYNSADKYIRNMVEWLSKEQFWEDHISTPVLNQMAKDTGKLWDLILKNPDKIWAYDGRVNDILRKFKDYPEMTELNTLLTMTQAQTRKYFAWSAVTPTEMVALEDFIWWNTKMTPNNLYTMLKTIKNRAENQYTEQRKFFWYNPLVRNEKWNIIENIQTNQIKAPSWNTYNLDELIWGTTETPKTNTLSSDLDNLFNDKGTTWPWSTN